MPTWRSRWRTGCCRCVWFAGLITDVRVISRRLVFIHAQGPSKHRRTTSGMAVELLWFGCDVGRWRLFSLLPSSTHCSTALNISHTFYHVKWQLREPQTSFWLGSLFWECILLFKRWCSFARSSYLLPWACFLMWNKSTNQTSAFICYPSTLLGVFYRNLLVDDLLRSIGSPHFCHVSFGTWTLHLGMLLQKHLQNVLIYVV